jgi:hypothetical protein
VDGWTRDPLMEPAATHRRHGDHMQRRWLLVALASALVVVACQTGAEPSRSPAPSPTPADTMSPEPTPSGLEGLVADLTAAGASAKSGSFFATEPIGGEGKTVCIGTETVQVYQFVDHEAALAVSMKIDHNDPSKIGTSIVDWAGVPRFWLRDRIIVLYIGNDAATDAALRSLLGRPFAEGQSGRMGLPTPPCT